MPEQYKEIKNIFGELQGVRRLSDGANIPIDPGNRDYAEYLKWVTEGGIVIPADPPLTPTEITAVLRSAAIRIISTEADGQAKVLRAVLLVIMDELNILRNLHSLPPRIATQIKTAVQQKINSGDSD
jgi:hypothetical protein